MTAAQKTHLQASHTDLSKHWESVLIECMHRQHRYSLTILTALSHDTSSSSGGNGGRNDPTRRSYNFLRRSYEGDLTSLPEPKGAQGGQGGQGRSISHLKQQYEGMSEGNVNRSHLQYGGTDLLSYLNRIFFNGNGERDTINNTRHVSNQPMASQRPSRQQSSPIRPAQTSISVTSQAQPSQRINYSDNTYTDESDNTYCGLGPYCNSPSAPSSSAARPPVSSYSQQYEQQRSGPYTSKKPSRLKSKKPSSSATQTASTTAGTKPNQSTTGATAVYEDEDYFPRSLFPLKPFPPTPAAVISTADTSQQRQREQVEYKYNQLLQRMQQNKPLVADEESTSGQGLPPQGASSPPRVQGQQWEPYYPISITHTKENIRSFENIHRDVQDKGQNYDLLKVKESQYSQSLLALPRISSSDTPNTTTMESLPHTTTVTEASSTTSTAINTEDMHRSINQFITATYSFWGMPLPSSTASTTATTTVTTSYTDNIENTESEQYTTATTASSLPPLPSSDRLLHITSHLRSHLLSEDDIRTTFHLPFSTETDLTHLIEGEGQIGAGPGTTYTLPNISEIKTMKEMKHLVDTAINELIKHQNTENSYYITNNKIRIYVQTLRDAVIHNANTAHKSITDIYQTLQTESDSNEVAEGWISGFGPVIDELEVTYIHM